MRQPPPAGRGALPAAPRDARTARSAPSQAPDINLPRRYTGAVDPGARAMRKVWWKCLAVLPLLGLALWWIRSDAQDAREVSAAPLAAGGAGGIGEEGGAGVASGAG